jgi:hypothetical protein
MCNEPTIAEMNFAIGIFDGRSFSGSHISDYTATSAPKLKYHSSWDWLMPVGKKIYDLLAKMAKQRPPHTACHGDMLEVDIHCHIREYDREKAHKAIYDFLQWYNKQKEANNER